MVPSETKGNWTQSNPVELNADRTQSISIRRLISIRFDTAIFPDFLDCCGLFFSWNEAGIMRRDFRLEAIEMRHGYIIYTSPFLLTVVEYELANQVLRCWTDRGFEIFQNSLQAVFIWSLPGPFSSIRGPYAFVFTDKHSSDPKRKDRLPSRLNSI